jgi:hypothetical protein
MWFSHDIVDIVDFIKLINHFIKLINSCPHRHLMRFTSNNWLFIKHILHSTQHSYKPLIEYGYLCGIITRLVNVYS